MLDAAESHRARPSKVDALPIGVPPLLCSRAESAAFLRIGTTLFDELSKQHPLLQPVRIGSRVLWPYENLVAYVRELKDAEPRDDPWGYVAV